MELKAESRAESGFPQGTLLPNIRSPGPTRLTVQQKRIPVDAQDKYGFTALHFARGKEMVRLLVERGADVHTRGKFQRTPLHQRKDPAAICFLLEIGLPIEVRSGDGSRPLHEAARRLWEPEARQLLEKGADVNAKKSDGASPLYEAISANPNTPGWLREKMVRLLLDYGADPINPVYNQGESALSVARARTYRKLVALFMERR
jgi:ankyrin repeat protein